jgi:hypothetical protein
MPARQGSANETGSDTRFGPAGFSSGADPGLPAALPLWLSARPKRKSDRRRHEARRHWSFVKAGSAFARSSLGHCGVVAGLDPDTSSRARGIAASTAAELSRREWTIAEPLIRASGARTMEAISRLRPALSASAVLAGGSVRGVNEGDQRADGRAERRAARELIGRYHQEQLGLLLEHVREGFARLDTGQINAFELDALIHRYKRSARELWKFCGQSGSGWLSAARTLRYLEAQGEDLPDWWAAGERHRRR